MVDDLNNKDQGHEGIRTMECRCGHYLNEVAHEQGDEQRNHTQTNIHIEEHPPKNVSCIWALGDGKTLRSPDLLEGIIYECGQDHPKTIRQGIDADRRNARVVVYEIAI